MIYLSAAICFVALVLLYAYNLHVKYLKARDIPPPTSIDPEAILRLQAEMEDLRVQTSEARAIVNRLQLVLGMTTQKTREAGKQ